MKLFSKIEKLKLTIFIRIKIQNKSVFISLFKKKWDKYIKGSNQNRGNHFRQ